MSSPMIDSSSLHPAAFASRVPPVRPNGRVLVVDDDVTIREGMTVLLESVGIDVVTHDSMITLPFVMRAVCPDAILLDIAMPALSGVSYFTVPHRQPFSSSTASVILFSGLPANQLSDLVQAFGADEFISKSEEAREIAERVRRAVERSRMRRTTYDHSPNA